MNSIPIPRPRSAATLVLIIAAVAAFLLGHLVAQPGQSPDALTAHDRQVVENLLSQMTLDEKIGQLNQLDYGMSITGPQLSTNIEAKLKAGKVGSFLNACTPAVLRKLQNLAVNNTRLRIPLLFGNDIIHGHKTIYPIPLGIAASWDMELIERCARMAAREASADGLNWTFSPMADITRDPRWGRVSEGAGEDPFLGSRVAQALVRGYQGDDLHNDDTIMACVKHFALYGAAEAGRDYNTVDMGPINMHQYYLPPYKAAIDAGAGSVMSSFNEINAVPATANKWLMTDLLRTQWHFTGFVVTDYTAINELTAHGIGDLKQNAARALDAGIDMDMIGEGYLTNLKQLLIENKVTEEQITTACRRVLEAKARLGLLDDPYKYINESRPEKYILTPENRRLAREAAERSIVLLKNKNAALPLKKGAVIALVGPLADDRKNVIGNWAAAGDWRDAVSLREGIKNIMGDTVSVIHAKGSNLIEDDNIIAILNHSGEGLEKDSRPAAQLLDEAVAAAQKADIIVAVLGESRAMTGEAASLSHIGLPACQRALLEALVKTQKPVVLVLMNGRPMTLAWENEHAAAILETWFAGTEAGNAIANVLFGNSNPSGKLPMCFPLTTGQIPVYYNHKNTGRPFDGKTLEKYKSRYLDIPNEPLYTFGYGLSYTTFDYSDITLSAATLTGEQTLRASVTVTNTGSRAGEEVVQLYIADPVASVTRSVKELKHFQKILLQPGESRQLSFDVTTEDLKFYDENLDYIWEPGDFIIQIGTNSADVKSATVHWQ